MSIELLAALTALAIALTGLVIAVKDALVARALARRQDAQDRLIARHLEECNGGPPGPPPSPKKE
jgi:hypothetical protein